MKKKIYIVGCVSLNMRNEFEWFYDEVERNDAYNLMQKNFEESELSIYRTKIDIEIDLKLSFKAMNDFINIKVSQHLKKLGFRNIKS